VKRLELALYAEGSTDQLFLPPVIVRTAQYILAQRTQQEVIIEPIEAIEVHKRNLGRNECIVKAAQKAMRYQALIVHSDADELSAENALRYRIQPGFELVKQQEQVCKNLLPIIPIQAIEAWMLADPELLRKEIGTHLSNRDLRIPERAIQVESIAKPKERLQEIIQRAYAEHTRRRRRVDLSRFYEPLGISISLERLRLVPSYKQFVTDLTATLEALNFW
jgi:hypothetical protein